MLNIYGICVKMVMYIYLYKYTFSNEGKKIIKVSGSQSKGGSNMRSWLYCRGTQTRRNAALV